jgi:2-deoxy-D-gluconate 3-dehydrogenase
MTADAPLDGRVAIVTGGNGGIGLALAIALGRAGAIVAIIGRDEAKNRVALASLQTSGVQASAHRHVLGGREECRRAVDDVVEVHGRVDVLVNNAGINIRKRPEAYTEAELAAVLGLDLIAPFHMCVAAYDAWMGTSGGSIVNIGSLLSVRGGALFAPYAMAKGGLVQMTRSLAVAWAQQGIRVNAILPGWFDTDLTLSARREVAGLDEKVIRQTPLGRWGDPDELGAAVVMMAGPGGSYVTGSVLSVDGGYGASL